MTHRAPTKGFRDASVTSLPPFPSFHGAKYVCQRAHHIARPDRRPLTASERPPARKRMARERGREVGIRFDSRTFLFPIADPVTRRFSPSAPARSGRAATLTPPQALKEPLLDANQHG